MYFSVVLDRKVKHLVQGRRTFFLCLGHNLDFNVEKTKCELLILNNICS